MKNLFFILVLILISAVLYWFVQAQLSVQQTPSSPAPTMESAPKAPVISKPAPFQELRFAQNTSPHKNDYSKKPQDGLVEFQVINGYAVAYGDTLLGKVGPDFQGVQGHAESPRVQTWDKPEIAYGINPSLPDPKRVERAIDYLRQHTVLQFVPYDGQRDAIIFEPGEEECLSYLGKMGGLQPIRLVPGCGTQQILHEILHALGFVHEQSRPDRDQFVEILWDNIDERYQSQFAMVPDSLVEPERDSPFDFKSIMLYRPSDFAARSGLSTMRALGPSQITPVSEGLSESDIARINRLYSN
jgi:hypothetical protein